VVTLPGGVLFSGHTFRRGFAQGSVNSWWGITQWSHFPARYHTVVTLLGGVLVNDHTSRRGFSY